MRTSLRLSLLVVFLFFPLRLYAASNLLEDLLRLPAETLELGSKTLEETIFNLGEIKVSGSRVSSLESDEIATDIPKNITVVGARRIEENGADNLPAVLSSLEGVTYSDDLGQGLNARVDLRGFGGEAKQALVLFDSLRAVEPFDNSVAWQLYPKEFVRKVEVERGGGSTIYGEGAFSGVIRLKTKEPTKEFKVSSENSLGSFQTQNHFVDAGGMLGPLGFYVGGKYENTDGYRQNGSHEGASALFKAKYDWTDLFSIHNSFYFADHETGIPGPLSAIEVASDRRQKDPEGQLGDQFADKLIQDELTLNYRIEPIGVELSNVAGMRFRKQDSIQSFGGFFGGTSVNDLETVTYSDVVQAHWGFHKDFFESDFTGGFEWAIDDIHNPFSFVSFSFGPFDAERAIDRRMLGYFVNERVKLWERLILEAGLRFDDIDWNIYDLKSPDLQKRKAADHLSPMAGIEYKLWKPLSVYASFSGSFKVPDSNALIFETPNLFSPNPNVDAQRARHSEAGVRYAHPVFGSVRADYFYIETKKEILFNDITNLNENFDTIRQGVELADEMKLSSWAQVFLNYTYTAAHFDNGAFDRKAIPLVPENKWSAGFVLGSFRGWTFSGQATGVYDQFALNDFNNIFPVEDYWVAGAKISYRQTYKKASFEAFARAENIFNEKYSSFVTSNAVDTVNFNPAPTTTWEGGVRMEF